MADEGTSEDDALAKPVSYVPRYAGVAERARLGKEFARASNVEVVERVPGSSSTDFWGVAHVPSQIEAEVLSPRDLDRRLDLLRACWAYFDDVASRVSAELRLGPRSAGRSRDQIIRHVYANEPEQWSRKVEVRTPLEVVLTSDGLATHRREYIDAIRAYNADGKPARGWPIQFLVRPPRTTSWIMRGKWRTVTSPERSRPTTAS